MNPLLWLHRQHQKFRKDKCAPCSICGITHWQLVTPELLQVSMHMMLSCSQLFLIFQGRPLTASRIILIISSKINLKVLSSTESSKLVMDGPKTPVFMNLQWAMDQKSRHATVLFMFLPKADGESCTTIRP